MDSVLAPHLLIFFGENAFAQEHTPPSSQCLYGFGRLNIGFHCRRGFRRNKLRTRDLEIAPTKLVQTPSSQLELTFASPRTTIRARLGLQFTRH
jgi:hypothetical protein